MTLAALLLAESLLAMTLTTEDYFNYDMCDESCKLTNSSCVITEVSKENFPCECIASDEACEAIASDYAVCLQKNKPPLGGSKIWNDYKNWKPSPSTIRPPTPPSPQPDPTSWTEWSKTIGLVFLIIVAVSNLILNAWTVWKRWKSEADSVSDSSPASPLLESQEDLSRGTSSVVTPVLVVRGE